MYRIEIRKKNHHHISQLWFGRVIVDGVSRSRKIHMKQTDKASKCFILPNYIRWCRQLRIAPKSVGRELVVTRDRAVDSAVRQNGAAGDRAWRGQGVGEEGARYLGSRGARRHRAECRRRAAGAAPAWPAAPGPSRPLRRALPQHTRSRSAAARFIPHTCACAKRFALPQLYTTAPYSLWCDTLRGHDRQGTERERHEIQPRTIRHRGAILLRYVTPQWGRVAAVALLSAKSKMCNRGLLVRLSYRDRVWLGRAIVIDRDLRCKLT